MTATPFTMADVSTDPTVQLRLTCGIELHDGTTSGDTVFMLVLPALEEFVPARELNTPADEQGVVRWKGLLFKLVDDSLHISCDGTDSEVLATFDFVLGTELADLRRTAENEARKQARRGDNSGRRVYEITASSLFGIQVLVRLFHITMDKHLHANTD